MKREKPGEITKTGQSNDPAMRFDYGKLRWELLPDDAIEKIVEVYSHGSLKYEDDNWRKGMKWNRVIGSMKRHIKAFTTGEDIDPDSGCLHIAMVAWNAITLLWYQLEGIDGDNRVKTCKDFELMIKKPEDIEELQIKLYEKISKRLIEESKKSGEMQWPDKADEKNIIM